ncbi:hypothetical protein [Oryza sativa Japonica Group]|uniref:HGWP repeat containing protein-like n=1 Tax=Oryza sativa subsp. japonica TaxID=39947 RepID=Q9FED8_ORYSJ|nr:hypothetical protein [Oryza sativa Japonica Group]BAB17324.1 hypothetical protein [Oryza sativa Japonica Group]
MICLNYVYISLSYFLNYKSKFTPPPPRIPPHPAFPARLNEGGIIPRDSLSRFPRFSLSLSLGFVRIAPAILADVINGARELRGRFPFSPAAFSPFRRYKIVPRASLFRFRHSPLALAVGFVPAPCSSLSAVAAELRFAAVVAPVLLPTRRHLHRLRRVIADPVRRSASPADRRSTVVIVIPNRAAAFLRSGRRSRRRRCPGVSRRPPFAFPLLSALSGAAPPRRWSPAVTIGARARPPPVGRAGEAAFGRALAAAKWARPSAARARSTVDRAADAWAPTPVDPVRAPSLG